LARKTGNTTRAVNSLNRALGKLKDAPRKKAVALLELIQTLLSTGEKERAKRILEFHLPEIEKEHLSILAPVIFLAEEN
jgi:hypothetical protein